MAGETIFVVDDNTLNLKLTALTLRSEGYQVHTAASGHQALTLVNTAEPDLMLVDVQMPGMSGLELTRRLKKLPRTSHVPVIALTASAMRVDQEAAIQAGCDGYITKPIDTRTLGSRVRNFLDSRPRLAAPRQGIEPAGGEEPAASALSTLPLTDTEFETLRRRFLSDAVKKTQQLLESVYERFDAEQAAHLLHQWVGAAGLLGYDDIAALAGAAGAELRNPPFDLSRLQEALGALLTGLAEPVEASEPPLPAAVIDELTGKRVALIGFGEREADEVCAALERAGVRPRLFEASESAMSPGVRDCHAAIVHVRPDTLRSPWLAEGSYLPARPLLLLGKRRDVLGLERAVQARASEVLIDNWPVEQVLMRLSFALTRGAPAPAAAAEPAPQPAGEPQAFRRPEILLADDDPTTLTLLRATLESYEIDCQVATSGTVALQMMRDFRPAVSVLDIDMPGMNGYEVLAAARAEALPVKILMLTVCGTVSDVVQGFDLGADDYVVKPFSAMELVARIKRLIAR
jgi:two-component system, cell cycle response regulator DivK